MKRGGTRAENRPGARGHVTVTGADETVVRVKGEKAVVGLAPDAATGQVLGLDVPVERDSDGFADRLRDFVSDFGVESMAADDLSAYKPVVRRLGIDHRICVARVKSGYGIGSTR